MEFSATWSSGSVPSDFDFLMSLVAHVTDTYPTTVFDVAYRPVMLTGVMLTGGSEALQKRSAALARDAPMGFQLALGLTVSPKVPPRSGSFPSPNASSEPHGAPLRSI